MRQQIRRTVNEPVDVDPADICTMKEAKALTGLSYPGLVAAIQRGALTASGTRRRSQLRRLP